MKMLTFSVVYAHFFLKNCFSYYSYHLHKIKAQKNLFHLWMRIRIYFIAHCTGHIASTHIAHINIRALVKASNYTAHHKVLHQNTLLKYLNKQFCLLQSGDQTKPLRRTSVTTKIAAALNHGLSSLGEKLGEEIWQCCTLVLVSWF